MTILFSSFAIRGLDVSQFNGTIDWSKVTEEKCDFVIIRAGLGRVKDAKFTANWAGAKAAPGVARSPYWYLDYYSNHNKASGAYGLSDEAWGTEQGDNCWSYYKHDSADAGIVFCDIESASPSVAPAISKVWTRTQAIAKAMLIRMDERNGKFNGIYCSLDLVNKFDDWFKDRPLWVAWYNEKQTLESVLAAVRKAGWRGPVVIWQYASHGDINGDGAGDGKTFGAAYDTMDLNAMFGAAAWKVVWGVEIEEPVIEDPIVVVPEEPVTGEFESYQVTIPVLNLRTQPVVADSTLIGKLFAGNPLRISQTYLYGDYVWGRLLGQGWWCCLAEGGAVYAKKV